MAPSGRLRRLLLGGAGLVTGRQETMQRGETDVAHVGRCERRVAKGRLHREPVYQGGDLRRGGLRIEGSEIARGHPIAEYAGEEARPALMLPLAHRAQPL